ncbi:uncharacterized protein PRCAT00006342001 [Priceomyces carsonii]|uniref:uncharacterized protein n=1 Tax=Priceomyces carsonii TaxID=28549 RepID=UPI002ED8A765|nr:unnamed protein product [Priceomyces carsonii]
MSGILVGQLICGGFQGTTVTPQAYDLIVKYKISSMILSRKNAVSVKQLSNLIRDLQYIAFKEGNLKHPIMFAIDEEGGMMNSLFDPENLTQMPGAMALSATGDTDLVYEILKALAFELKAIGFLIILGPVLDVVTKLSHQLVGVRSFGTTLEDVVKYGKACARGLKDGGLFTMGKHFPGIGNANVDSLLELPMIADSLDQIKHFNSIPFVELMHEGLLDGVSAAGCGVPTISPDETHACLSPVLINQFLRNDLKFNGVVISECLEMDALYHSIGLGQGVILAIQAGCDLVMVCHDFLLQKEAIESLQMALINGNIDEEVIMKSFERLKVFQSQLQKWEEMFPNGEKKETLLFKDRNFEAWQRHQRLSAMAYQKSITLIRDYGKTLPITKNLSDLSNVLLLTPLLNPIYPTSNSGKRLFPGEQVFQKFGKFLSEHPKNKSTFNVLHTTYTANGLTALHESLIESSKVVIVLTSEASRNMYQIGIVKYVSVLCGAKPNASNSNLSKRLIIAATLSPYDFFYNKSIGSAYLCCYDYTDNSLRQLVGALMGDFEPSGCIPGEKRFLSKFKKRKRSWLVDELQINRDWPSLVNLIKENINIKNEQSYKKLLELLTLNPKQKHFIVRNSSLNILYGVVLTWVNEEVNFNTDLTSDPKTFGSLMFILVDKSKRLQYIGRSLYERATKYLVHEKKCYTITLGGLFPLFPSNDSISYVGAMGWGKKIERKHIMLLSDLESWVVPNKIFRELMIVGVRFDIGTDSSKLMNLVNTCEDEQVKRMYVEAIKSINRHSTIYEVKIIIALEPTNQNVIGSIIMFTNKSQFAQFYPFIEEIESKNAIGGIVSPLVDPSYSNLVEIFNFGLICSAITFLKSHFTERPVKKCLILGVEERSLDGIKLMGFEEWKTCFEITRPASDLPTPGENAS